MHKLLISLAIAGLATVSSPAWAQDTHHDHTPPPAQAKSAPKQMPMSCPKMKAGKHHAMHGKSHKMACMHGKKGDMMAHDMKGMHDGHQMMGGDMDKGHMQQMHGQMNHGAMMGGAQPTATPTPAKPK